MAAPLLAAIVACNDGTSVRGPLPLSLNFRVTGPPSLASGPEAGGPARVSGPLAVAGPPLILDGTNGTLTIDEIRLIINEVELEPADGSCDSVEDASDDPDCPEFEAPPRFLDLPLDGEPIDAVTALIPPGTYKALDFEVEDLEDDEGNLEEAAAIDDLRTQIMAEIGDWPLEASALVAGSFAPTSGGSVGFRVFLKAEIEVEMALVPNLVVADDGSANRELTVDIRPDIWFGRADGSLLPLHLYDYDTTGELLEFDVEMEDGFTEIEIGS
jgi:hypothetical protein